VIVTEKKLSSPLIDETSSEKVSLLCDSIGMVYSGMGPDSRVLLDKGRKAAQKYKLQSGENPSVRTLTREVANVMQEYTQSGGVRPFGVSLLIAGCDRNGHWLYQVDPSGAYWTWLASAIGKNMVNAKAFLEKRYNESMELEDAIHTAILTLKEGYEGEMNEHNIEIGITDYNTGKFRLLEPVEIKDYLSNVM
jgi:20S proteasome subunit alpha 2